MHLLEVLMHRHGVPERLALLTAHRAHIQTQLDVWARSLAVIDGKIADYTRRLATEHDDDPTA